MPTPSKEQIDRFLRHQIDLWDAGKLDQFKAAFREIAPGGFKVQDPVGSPERSGWPVLDELCERYAGWHMEVQDVLVNGAHAAMYVKNTGTYNGQPIIAFSVETYYFADDGSMLACYYHPTTA
jgi:hypothetical protein